MKDMEYVYDETYYAKETYMSQTFVVTSPDVKFLKASNVVLKGSMAVYNDYAGLQYIGIAFYDGKDNIWKVGDGDCFI